MTELERLTHLRHLLSAEHWQDAIEITEPGDWVREQVHKALPDKHTSIVARYLLSHLPKGWRAAGVAHGEWLMRRSVTRSYVSYESAQAAGIAWDRYCKELEWAQHNGWPHD